MSTATRRIQFCAGHRVLNHESKCANMHGHNYVAMIEVGAANLDAIGRVVDFSVIKALVGTWIDDLWDHGFIFNKDDDEVERALHSLTQPPQKVFEFPVNPTAENMAEYLFWVAAELLACHGVSVHSIRIWETENCYADFHGPRKLKSGDTLASHAIASAAKWSADQ